MRKARFAIFGAILLGGIAAAVGTLWAQDRPNRDDQGRRLFMLGGRGSQIGVMVEDLTAAELKELKGATSGVRIEDVDMDSPAAKAGLREGDIVVEFDGERIRSARQFTRLIEETPDGRSVALGVLRNGQRQTLTVTPENRAFGWGFDGDRIGRDIARGMRDLEPRLREIEPRLRELEPRLRELEPRLREFRFDPPAFDFNFDFDFDNLLPGGARGRLGVQIESLSPQLADYFGVKDGGVLVSSVTTGSPAEKAGLKAGDVIISIDGDRVRGYNDLISELGDKTGEVTIGIVRDKKETTLKTTLEPPQRRTRRLLRPAV